MTDLNMISKAVIHDFLARSAAFPISIDKSRTGWRRKTEGRGASPPPIIGPGTETKGPFLDPATI